MIIAFLRRLFRMCDHNWKTVDTVKLNEFEYGDDLGTLDPYVPADYDIVSSRDFNKQVCTHCGDFRFRKS